MRYFEFELLIDKWYVVLPDWVGDKEELEMVSGADSFLYILAQGEQKVTINVSENTFDGYKYKLEFIDHASGGGDYHLISEMFEFPVWLCHVTKFVFGYLPKNLYIS